MTRYRKRGAEVDAFQWDGAGQQEPAWFQALVTRGKIRRYLAGVAPTRSPSLHLDPPGARFLPFVANLGDWIVRNARGEVFPMTAEKFAETYEPEDGEYRCRTCGLYIVLDVVKRASLMCPDCKTYTAVPK